VPKVKSITDTAREFYGDNYDEFAAMGPKRMSARARAHMALVDRVQCAPRNPAPGCHADAPALRHDWLCDDVTDAIEEGRKWSLPSLDGAGTKEGTP
jgi:hypothetical protein